MKKGARQLQLGGPSPSYPTFKKKRVWEDGQALARILLSFLILTVLRKSFLCARPTSDGVRCHQLSCKARTHQRGDREEEGPLVLLLWHLPCLWPCLAHKAITENSENRSVWYKVYVQLQRSIFIQPIKVRWKGAVSAVKAVNISVLQGSVITLQHHGPQHGHCSKGESGTNHVSRWPGHLVRNMN